MKLTTMSRYGTRAVFDIAYHSKGLPVQVKDIAERQQIPLKYLEQIFHKLKNTDFIKSERGPGGGYVLTKDPNEITVGDIIKAVKEDRISFPVCAVRLRMVPPVHGRVSVLQDLFGKKQPDRLQSTSIQ